MIVVVNLVHTLSAGDENSPLTLLPCIFIVREMEQVHRKSYTKEILILGIPLLAGNFSFYLLQIADTIMVGRLGTEPLGAIAMAGLFSGILMTFIWPVSIGVQALAARRFGKFQKVERETDESTGNTIDNGIIVGIIMGLFAFLFSFSAPFFLSLLIKDPALKPLSLSYIRIIKWGLPLGGIMMAAMGFLGGVKKTRYIMTANIGGSLINIALNYLFIFGKLGFPAMGMAGAALGTVVSEIIQVIYLYTCIVRNKDLKIYHTLRFGTLDFTLMKNMVRVFSPLVVQNIFALSVFLVYESIIGRIGTIYLAATSVVFSIFRINKTIVGGFARGAAILIGNALGAMEDDKSVDLVHAAAKISAVIGAAILLTILLSPDSIVSIFTKDVKVLALGIKAMYFFAAFFFIEVLGYTLEIIFGGIGWGRYVLLSETTTNVVFIIGTSLLLQALFPSWGIYAAWTGFALYQIGHAGILFIGYLSRRWIKIEVDKTNE